MDAVNNYSYVPERRINRNENQEQSSAVSENAEAESNIPESEEDYDKPILIQSVDGDESSLNETDIYVCGDENQFAAVMKSKDIISNEKIDAANIQVAPRVSVYHANIYDNQDRLTMTTTGAEVTLYEDKVKDEETGLDKVKNHLSAYYQSSKLEHFDVDPTVNYGFSYTFDDSSVSKKTSTDAKDFKNGDKIGKIEINAEWQKDEGLQKYSFSSEIGHGTILKLGKESEFSTAALTHEKVSANHDKNIQEEVELKYMDKKNFSAKYSVDNKGITKWGISAEKQEGENRYGIFFNMPL